jgi:zinc protease
MPYTLENDVRADMAGQVLEMIYLKKIREEASAAYTVNGSCRANLSDDMHEIYMSGVCPMKPEKSDTAINIMRSVVPTMAKTVDESMLTKVKEYLLKTYDNAVKDNDYWLGVLNQYRKFGLDSHTGYKALVNKQTPATIEAFMKELLKNSNTISVVMLPEQKKK